METGPNWAAKLGVDTLDRGAAVPGRACTRAEEGKMGGKGGSLVRLDPAAIQWKVDCRAEQSCHVDLFCDHPAIVTKHEHCRDVHLV